MNHQSSAGWGLYFRFQVPWLKFASGLKISTIKLLNGLKYLSQHQISVTKDHQIVYLCIKYLETSVIKNTPKGASSKKYWY